MRDQKETFWGNWLGGKPGRRGFPLVVKDLVWVKTGGGKKKSQPFFFEKGLAKATEESDSCGSF